MKRIVIATSLLAALLSLQGCGQPASTNTPNRQTENSAPAPTTPKPRPTPVRKTASTALGSRAQTAEHQTAPAGATARCRDGTYSYSQNHRGTCSHHGGVAQWLD